MLIQNIDGDVTPRILFLKQLLNSYELTEILLHLPSIIVMSFHMLICIVFLQQKTKIKEISKEKRDIKLTKINLNNYNIEKRHLEINYTIH